jgi:hypothetical protein
MALRASTSSIGNSITPAVSVPAGVAADDIILLGLSVDNSGSTFSTHWPTGFTNLADLGLTLDGQRVGVAYKRATGADAGSYTMGSIGGAGNFRYAMGAQAFSGRHTTNNPAISATSSSNAANGSPVTVTANGVTAVAADDIAFFSMPDVNAADIGNGHSGWSGSFVEKIDVEGDAGAGNGWSNLGVATWENASAGATGSQTVTFTLTSGAAGWAAWLVRIPAAAGGGGATVHSLSALGAGS